MPMIKCDVNGTEFSVRVSTPVERDEVIEAVGRSLCRRYKRQHVRTHRQDSRAANGSYETVQFTIGDDLGKVTGQRSDRGTTTNVKELFVTIPTTASL